MGPLSSAMTSADSLSLIPRRLDEIERKLDRMMEELRTTPTPSAIRYPRCQMRSAGCSSRMTRSTRRSVLDSRRSIPRCNTMKQTANASVGTLAQLAFIG
jgi:hypothetical protein